MSFALGETDLERLKAALRLLNEIERDYGVDVCAHGGIDVEIGDGQYLRLEHYPEGVGYVFVEPFR